MTPDVLNRVSNNFHKRHQVNIRWLISLQLTLSRATDESIEEYMQSLLAVKHKLWNSQWKYLRFGFNMRRFQLVLRCVHENEKWFPDFSIQILSKSKNPCGWISFHVGLFDLCLYSCESRYALMMCSTLSC